MACVQTRRGATLHLWAPKAGSPHTRTRVVGVRKLPTPEHRDHQDRSSHDVITPPPPPVNRAKKARTPNRPLVAGSRVPQRSGFRVPISNSGDSAGLTALVSPAFGPFRTYRLSRMRSHVVSLVVYARWAQAPRSIHAGYESWMNS